MLYTCFQYVTNYVLVKNLIPTLIIHSTNGFLQISSISHFYLRYLIAWREDDASNDNEGSTDLHLRELLCF